MKRILLYRHLIALFPVIVFGQIPKHQPLPVRQISDMVTDSADHPIIDALIKLVSKSDTLTTHSNEDGLFFFKDVKSWEFTLSVSRLGYRTFLRIGKYSDSNPRITLDRIILRTSSQMLQEVVVKTGPSIIYKEDTVEYQASDYVVRENASVGELLSKMDGMAVFTRPRRGDGSFIY